MSPSQIGNKKTASKDGEQSSPDLSVVVVAYNISRELPRTLLSLSTKYQRDIRAEEYEVIVVDNGSTPPVEPTMVTSFGDNFHLIRIDSAPKSPAPAVNRGIAQARGDVIGVMVDGARLVTPGLLNIARQGARLYDTAVVAALGWYLGYDFQRWAMQAGYDRAREDILLAKIDWPQDGYRLFEIGTPDESSAEGWLKPIAEANALFMRREAWKQLGGMDERFALPGGGLANLDMFARAVGLPNARLVVMLGEATFHQLHGGVATNLHPNEMMNSWRKWAAEYESIRGKRYSMPKPVHPTSYIGTLPQPVLAHFARNVIAPIRSESGPPLGARFDQQMWSAQPIARPKDPVAAALVDIAQQQFRLGRYFSSVIVCRMIRERFPDEPEPQRLLSIMARGLDQGSRVDPDHLVVIGDVHRLVGEKEKAAASYREALKSSRDHVRAHVGLATLRMSGDFYYDWLERLYSALAPKCVLEIGIFDGASLAKVPPSAMAIGIDPKPKLLFPPKAQTHIFPETSDEFFARRGAETLLAGRPVDIGFIDGLHLYEQSLRDFINIERLCGPRSVILLHDTVPLDEATQSRTCDTKFHTGDVWKTVLCLKHYRPDLNIFTIAAPWTGLTVVASLNPSSRVLADKYDEAVARFIETPYSQIENNLWPALNIVPNDWDEVKERLKASQVL